MSSCSLPFASSEREAHVHSPRDYEYYLKKWRYRQNIRGTEWKYVGIEIEKRRQLGKRSEVLLAGRRQLPERVRRQTQLHQSRPKLGGGTSPSIITTRPQIREIELTSSAPMNLDSNSGVMSVQVQTPPLVVCDDPWPRDLPWLKFNRKFGGNIHNPSGTHIMETKTYKLL